MIVIYCTIKSLKENIISVINDLHGIINNESFCVESDFVLIIKDKPDDIQHSTSYTLADLDYESEDVIDTLNGLKIENYSETLIDKDNIDPPLLYVFGKMIDGKMVYIKLKIRCKEHKRIICVSFHYASREMNFPYA